jgi:diguanylate cyclase (GGDEF)-like protein
MNKLFGNSGSDPLRWNRKMLNLYWMLFAFAVLAQFLYMWTEPDPDRYLRTHLAPTALWWLAGLGSMEAVLRRLRVGGDYVMIAGMAYDSFILMLFHYETIVVVTTLFFPLLVSMFYLQRRKVFFAYLLTLAEFVLLYLIRHESLPYLLPKHIFVVASALCVGACIIDAFMKRSAGLERDLRRTIEWKQELMIQNTLMDKLAKTDALTGLYNHMTFHEYLDDLIEQSEWSLLPLHLALIDIDDFKRINDTYGHRAGDAVLQRVAQTIREEAGEHDFAARYGGEEFAVIFTEKTLDEVVLMLENMRKRIALISHPELAGHTVTVSIGLGEYKRGQGKERLFGGADEALYAAKSSGKNKVIVHERYPEPTLF